MKPSSQPETLTIGQPAPRRCNLWFLWAPEGTTWGENSYPTPMLRRRWRITQGGFAAFLDRYSDGFCETL